MLFLSVLNSLFPEIETLSICFALSSCMQINSLHKQKRQHVGNACLTFSDHLFQNYVVYNYIFHLRKQKHLFHLNL